MERALVDLAIDWPTWWRIVAAIVVGCGIYDLLLWSWETVWAAVRDGLDWLRDYRARKRIGSRVRGWYERLWARFLSPDEDPDTQVQLRYVEPESYVPEVPETFWVLNESTKALHRRGCKHANMDVCVPWHWASTLRDAKHYATEQGLKTGCSCRPLLHAPSPFEPVEAS
jgi:hypothetical protein